MTRLKSCSVSMYYYSFPFCYFISTKREGLAKTAQLVKVNETCDNVPTIKAARLDIGAKLVSLILKSVDVPADGNCFLHAARCRYLRHLRPVARMTSLRVIFAL